MSRFCPQARHLYLLALFQLVGGPLVILAVVFFCRMTAQHATDHGVTTGIVKVWQSPEWEAVAQALVGMAQERQRSHAPDTVPPVQDPFGKLVVEVGNLLQVPCPQSTVALPPTGNNGLRDAGWPQAPPSPPPKIG
jgi:hypothetical protein